MLLIDRGFAVLLLIGAALHVYGTFLGYDAFTELWVWSLAATLAAGLVAAINLLRTNRLMDSTLALIAGISALLWVAVVLAFGHAIGSFLDFRVLWHAGCALGLAIFAFRQAGAYRVGTGTSPR